MPILQTFNNWSPIPPKVGCSTLIVQFRSELDGFQANRLILRPVGDTLDGIVLEEGASITLSGGGTYEVRAEANTEAQVRYIYTP